MSDDDVVRERQAKRWLFVGMLGSLIIGGLITATGYILGGGLAITHEPDGLPEARAMMIMVGGILLAIVGGLFSMFKASRLAAEL